MLTEVQGGGVFLDAEMRDVLCNAEPYSFQPIPRLNHLYPISDSLNKFRLPDKLVAEEQVEDLPAVPMGVFGQWCQGVCLCLPRYRTTARFLLCEVIMAGATPCRLDDKQIGSGRDEASKRMTLKSDIGHASIFVKSSKLIFPAPIQPRRDTAQWLPRDGHEMQHAARTCLGMTAYASLSLSFVRGSTAYASLRN